MGDSPPIEVFGITILEPMTSFTDLVTALVCFYAFYRLTQLRLSGRVYNWLRYYFLMTGIATACAAFIGHAFLYLFSFEWKMIGWVFSATGIVLIELGSIEYVKPHLPKWLYKILMPAVLIQYVAFWVVMLVTKNFLVTQAQAGIGLVAVVFPLHLYHYWKTRHRGSGIIVGAILFSILPGITYNTQLTFHHYFNYHDISHLLMATSMFILYRGVYHVVNHYAKVTQVA